MQNSPEDNPVILFDGVCNLCSSTVQFVIKNDKNQRFSFASLQSHYGLKLLANFNLSNKELNSFILHKDGKIFTRSTGALMVARELNTPWSWLYFLMIIPAPVRNFVYSLIAKNRYKWFGKKEACWIPSPNLKSRFFN
jgi:predicted DCC family thiol-disulfide oxidoreductase YuxK